MLAANAAVADVILSFKEAKKLIGKVVISPDGTRGLIVSVRLLCNGSAIAILQHGSVTLGSGVLIQCVATNEETAVNGKLSLFRTNAL
jgi:hypothetical protein